MIYCSEVSDLDTGLLLEVWEKGMLWDKAIGYYWCPLNTIPFTQVTKPNQIKPDETKPIYTFRKIMSQNSKCVKMCIFNTDI